MTEIERLKEVVEKLRAEDGCPWDLIDDTIELRCKKCNMKIMEYKLQHDDKACALNGISLKCTRCKRIMILMRYTEAIIREGSAVADGRMVKKI